MRRSPRFAARVGRVVTASAVVGWVAFGCGHASQQTSVAVSPGEPVASSSSSTAAPEQAEQPQTRRAEKQELVPFPEKCESGAADGLCLPPEPFVKALCASGRTDAALALFSKGSPWTRRYVRGKVLAWDATGQASEKVQLQTAEEVIVLRHRGAPAGGMVVSGASDGYDVVRWDGTCVSLDGGELADKPYGRAAYARLDWRNIDEAAQERLLTDDAVKKAYKERHNECKGVTMGTVSKKCVLAHKHLSKAIVDYVRRGGELPKPTLEPVDP